MVLQGRTISIDHHIDSSTVDVSDIPPFTKDMSLINDEEPQDNVYANRTDHEKGLWENYPL